MRKPTKDTLGDLLVQSLTEVRDGLRGRPGKLTMKTLEIPDPPHFIAAAVHKVRDQLGLSQGLFAKPLGVSRKLVEAWEAGTGAVADGAPPAWGDCAPTVALRPTPPRGLIR